MTTPTSWSATETTLSAGDREIDALVYGSNWVSPTITFSFANVSSVWASGSYSAGLPDSNEPYMGFSALNLSQMQAVRNALGAWANVANLQFVEVVDNATVVGDLRFAFTGGNAADDAQAWGYMPGPYAAAGDVWFSNSSTSYSSYTWDVGSYEYMTAIHEIGHTLGLKHPFDNDPSENGGITLPKSIDARSYTVMSYAARGGDGYTYFSYEPTTPMVLDIAAMQYIYGANMSHNAGDNTYTYSGSGFYNETIWDAGGTDTIVYSSSIGGVIDLREGVGYGSRVGQAIEVWRGYSHLGDVNNVWIANGAVIENATGGSGNDKIFGNEANNLLNGGAGMDSLAGGAGDDTYIVALKQVGSNPATASVIMEDTIKEGKDQGDDTITLTGDFGHLSKTSTLVLAANIEVFDASQTDDTRLNLTGNALDNTLIGNIAANVLNGGTGVDEMQGGIGDDTYVIDRLDDIIVENAAEGTDLVCVSIATVGGTYTLGANLENAELKNTVAYNLIGNELDNVLSGNAAANCLDGAAGADTMKGGAGNDICVVEDVGDIVIETANAGTDTVESSISYALGDNVENLTLTGAGNIAGTGNALANVLIGNAGTNMLTGGAGNDTYYVGTDDTVVELMNGGTDTIVSEVNFDLNDAENVENLTLAAGAGSLNGTGNALANRITGNEGDNVLTGGAGADTLAGGLGNDTYHVNLAQVGTGAKATVKLEDTVTEGKDVGIDTVVLDNEIITTLTTTLTLGANLENLDASVTGSTRLNLTGNAAANILTGNDADNILNGGAGEDSLIGGDGNDTYVVDHADDSVTEDLNKGTDLVQVLIAAAGGTYALEGNVENGILLNKVAYNLAGNELDNVLTGNAAANTLDGGAGVDTMAGGAGNDTYVVDDAGDTVTEALNAGVDTVQSSVEYTLGNNVENLTLTGTDNIVGTGNALANILTGNDGANALFGGLGNDTYVVGWGDVVFEYAGQGVDTIVSALEYDLNFAAEVENLTLSGTDDINGFGNLLSNVIVGNAGINELDGRAGADVLKGGAGNDTYWVDLVSVGSGAKMTVKLEDTVVEAAGQGTDTLILRGSPALTNATTLVLAATLENLDASQTSGATKLNLTGNAAANILTGNTANNILNGAAGADIMIGGDGDDTYVVDNTGDVVTEQVSGGTQDLVQVAIALAGQTYVLGDNIENAQLKNTVAYNLTGNALGNILTGNAKANTLIGLDGSDTLNGGAGADTLKGGSGSDIYIVDNVNDIVDEEGNTDAGDQIQASISIDLSLSKYDGIENVILTGTAALNATGDDANNALHGNDGANTLDGRIGADIMVGYKGNDTYRVDNAGDIVSELANAGTDTVESSIDYILGSNVENLTLNAGAGSLNGTGNALANRITGNEGDNDLTGDAGADTLAGGLGNDTYHINLAQVGTGAKATVKLEDTVIEGKDVGIDTVVLDNEIITTLTTTLTLGANLENLDASATGSTRLNLTGNAAANILTGNDADNVIDGGAGDDTLYGGLGDDTYVLGSEGDTLVENADEGNDTIKVGFLGVAGMTISLADYANIESITLTNTSAFNLEGNELDNILKGNAKANILIGWEGDDVLDGGAGADTLIGGDGNDIYVVDSVADIVDEQGSADTDDLIRASISIDLTSSSYANIEHVTLTGAAALNATGNSEVNILIGNDGANRLDGGAGADQMTGGKGNDTYIVDDLGDVLTELAGGGTDTIESSVSWVLGANFENLTLTGSADINATGNDGNNILRGNGGVNTLAGGEGDDTYYVGTGDTIVEEENQGTDTIVSSGSLTLDGDSSIENLTLSGIGNFYGYGSSVANKITGNSGNNTLDGKGGVDTLIGGLGNDTYRVDLVKVGTGAKATVKLEDTVTETANAGNDTIELRGNLTLDNATTLTAATNIENIDASETGSTKLNLSGNSGNNKLTGNDADNVLDGKGGVDTLVGGDGDDIYIVDLIQSGNLLGLQDQISEAAGAGNDTIQLRGSLVLSAATTFAINDDSTIENIDASRTGNSKINLIGNADDNILIGNAAANILDGGDGDDRLVGGAGADQLTGGDGNDTFVFLSATDSGNIITDFDVDHDVLEFSASAFAALGPVGALDADKFGTFSNINNPAEIRLIYNEGSHQLYYDADGIGVGQQMLLIATLSNVSGSLTAADFILG